MEIFGEVKRRLFRFSNVFYLTDNCGEVVFDLFVIGKLVSMGKRVVVGSKSEPVLNDVTVQEISAMIDTEVTATGNVVGTALEHLRPEARSLLFDPSWLILSKGMGNFRDLRVRRAAFWPAYLHHEGQVRACGHDDWGAQGNFGGKINLVHSTNIFIGSSYPLLKPPPLPAPL